VQSKVLNIYPCSRTREFQASWQLIATEVTERQTSLITGRATAGIAITQQAILRFFAPQGRHDLRISVKFGMTCRAKVHEKIKGDAKWYIHPLS